MKYIRLVLTAKHKKCEAEADNEPKFVKLLAFS
jgi:hypothetical protein